MKRVLLGILAAGLAGPACASPSERISQAMETCFAAVIDGRPTTEIRAGDLSLSLTQDPTACTVRAAEGEPAALREAVMAAVHDRPEGFKLAPPHWAPGPYAQRETFCAAPGGRHFAVLVSTGRPGAPGAKLMATVLESAARDPRCDLAVSRAAPGKAG